MLFALSQLSAPVAGHAGFVAGRYRDGAASDQWTDVSRCSPRTFTAYAGACTCGWRGAWRGADAVGLVTARRAWLTEHVPSVLSSADRRPAAPAGRADVPGSTLTS